ncbi:GntR family transcriptional regulator [Acidianus manzaensis]|uniref:GntR family transcriptional regulator n=1 Tax=Acidianus manzaensis TaxID=282676 RepID=A0A1W6JYX2_9CREN|nr:GntR family transcriptional regulator [Acidianus manzaensis]ARM75447.1 GntR family transcriptional regulator [Acidianus manzaensis]
MTVNLSEKAYNDVLNMILKGKYKQGQRITEEQLCKDLNMSRTPVREALKMLISEGIIKKENKSYSIVSLSSDEVLMLYEIRLPLEATAAYLASERATEEDLKKMDDLLQEIKIETEKSDPDPLTLSNLNGNFHNTIAVASKNKYLQECLNDIRVKLKIIRVTLFSSYERRKEEYEEHNDIFEAIKSRNSEEAKKLMEDHENNVLKYIKQRIFMFS